MLDSFLRINYSVKSLGTVIVSLYLKFSGFYVINVFNGVERNLIFLIIKFLVLSINKAFGDKKT